MNEKTTKRREWVKNTAIIFLTILLILTFFSNTFMNYSLPEVATQYVQSGSITAKIRGTGTVEASDPYNLVINDTRTIANVAVKSGDEVAKGDTIFVLEEKDSVELKEAKTELISLETALQQALLNYELKLLDGSLSAETVQGVQGGSTDSVNSAQAKIQAASDKLKNLRDTKAGYEASVTNIDTQLALMSNSTSYDEAAKAAAVNSATQQLNAANAQLASANAQLEAAKNWFNGLTTQSDANASVVAAEQTMKAEQDLLAQVIGKIESGTGGSEVYNGTQLGNPQLAEEYTSILDARNMIGKTWNEIRPLLQSTCDKATANYKAAQSIATNFSTKQRELVNAENAVAAAKQQVANCEATIANLSAGSTSTDVAAQKKALDDQKAQLQASITNLTAQIDQASQEHDQVLADVAGEFNLDFQSDEISRAREAVKEKEAEVAKLEEEAANPVITSPVDGKITSLSYASGETTTPGEPAAVIQVAGKGYTMSFSVTTEQAKKVAVGDMAELQNSWYYNDMTLKLTSIKPDPTNPTQNRLLVFDVSGDEVTAGQSLSVSVGQKSSNYDLIVPNSAIREDNNGKFILIVESKSSPLGTRYYATRVDVEVLATDDTQTAISAALYGYEYVITTSTKPVEAGKMVRLPD